MEMVKKKWTVWQWLVVGMEGWVMKLFCGFCV